MRTYGLFFIVGIYFIVSCKQPEVTPIYDYESGLAQAKQEQRAIFLIFDLFGSSNTNVEEHLSDADIVKVLEDYIVIRLMCDDRKMFNDSMTIGHFNAQSELDLVGRSYQPCYCFLNPEGELISEPIGYCQKDEMLEYVKTFEAK